MKSNLIRNTLFTLSFALVGQAFAGPISGAGGGPSLSSNDSVSIGSSWMTACVDNGGFPAVTPPPDLRNGYSIIINENNNGYLAQYLASYIKSSGAFTVKSCSWATDYSSSDGLILYREYSPVTQQNQRLLQIYVTRSQLASVSIQGYQTSISIAGEFAGLILKNLESQITGSIPQGSSCYVQSSMATCSVDTGQCTLNISPMNAASPSAAALHCPVSVPPPPVAIPAPVGK